MKYRFYSDSNQAQFGYALRRLRLVFWLDGYAIEVLEDSPEVAQLASDLGGLPEAPEKPDSSTGVEAFDDRGAFSTRSSALNMPGYQAPPVTTVIPKTARRKTRGQP